MRGSKLKLRGRNAVAAVWLLLFAELPNLTELEAQVPRGIFSLSGSGQPAGRNVLSNPDVIGVSVRQAWYALEPSEGNFDWSFLESEIARAAAAGKIVMIRIGTQSGKPAWVTTAIQNAGGTFFTFDDNGVSTTIPVFWNPTYRAEESDDCGRRRSFYQQSDSEGSGCQLCQCHERRLERAA